MTYEKVRRTVWKRGKCIVAMLMLLILETYAVPTSSAGQNGGGPPRIMVLPESIVDPTLTPGKNFTISIYTNYRGEDIWGYEFTLAYNSSILNCVEVTNGDLITEEDGPIMFLTAGVNNEAGQLRLTGNGFFFISKPAPLIDGPGTLANVTFTVVGIGASDITLGSMTKLVGYGEGINPGTNGTEPGWGDMFNIIDSTKPDRLMHGFFANSEGWSNMASAGQLGEPVDRLLHTQVQASSGLPWDPITMWAVDVAPGVNMFYGNLAGYEDMMHVIQENLAEIGINLKIERVLPIVWLTKIFEQWNVTGDADGNPEGYNYDIDGWDFTVGEFFFMPTGLTWLEEAMYSWMTWDTGVNVFPWLNGRADYLLHKAMTNLDQDTREAYLWAWQEEFMHDPPMVNIYYPKMYGGTTVWVEGWDPVVQFNDVSRLTINVDEFDEHADAERKALGDDTLIYGLAEGISYAGSGVHQVRLGYPPDVLSSSSGVSFNPLFTSTRKEDVLRLLTHDTLYSLSRDPWPDGLYVLKPNLAADFPSWYDSEDLGYELGHTVARIPLEPQRFWSNGMPFNASDVKLTFDCILDVYTRATAYYAVSNVVKNVEIVDEYTVDFILDEPYPDLVNLLAMEWGCAIVPWHQLKDIPHDKLRTNVTNTDWRPVSQEGQGLEGTGAFIPTSFDEVAGYFEVTRQGGYANHLSRIIVKDIDEVVTRLWALQGQDVDFCEPVVASVEEWETMKSWDTHRVINYTYPASNPLWMNLHNRILSNRYVRLAIAHAIDYPRIFSQILPGWGIPEPYPGKALITPLHDSFNYELQPYSYDPSVAESYMNMWHYSQVGELFEYGPVGDADFSGFVDFDDFFIWYENYGTSPDEWSWIPGRDIDPDFTNDGAVTLWDFNLWSLCWGNDYPFQGAR